MRRHFPELTDLEALIADLGVNARSRKVAEVEAGGMTYPVHAIAIGSQDPAAPSLGFFAGAHGLERIGCEVVLAYLHTLIQLLRWDRAFVERLKHSRLVFVPLLNPVGVRSRTRSNGNGVDLIRNSPLDAEDPGGPIFRGHRLSPWLPWYRGPKDGRLEIETEALFDVVRTELLPSRVSLSVDVHSGFGARDRLWFPYAHTRRPYPFLAEAYRLKELFDQTYPHHVYVVEPMSRQYTIHGDPWDYLFEEHRRRADAGFFMPFTLEMGSWIWLKKNPLQLFLKDGVFNPVVPHRRKRILRRHLNLFDFLHRAILSPEAWLEQSKEQRALNQERALGLWYGP